MENREIERKWLISAVPENLEQYECLTIEQAYLSTSPTVRVRKENEEYYLTYKGSRAWDGNSALSHTEYNLPLDRASYEHLREKRDGRLIRKNRYRIPCGDLTIELDVFDPPIAPLILAEVEFPSEEAALAFRGPDWFGEDVTEDPRFRNAAMASDPDWKFEK